MRRRYGGSWGATLVLGMAAVLAAGPGTAAGAAVRSTPVDPAAGAGEVTVSVRVLPSQTSPPGADELPVTGTGAVPELLALLGVAVLVLGLLLVAGARRAARRRAG